MSEHWFYVNNTDTDTDTDTGSTELMTTVKHAPAQVFVSNSEI